MGGTAWTPAQVAHLVERYMHDTAETIAATIGRSVRSVYSKARDLRLTKSPEFYASALSGRTGCVRVGISTRFQKGHATWNKGLNFAAGGKSIDSQFKKGSKPWNTTPLGHERVCGGYRQRKVTDTGCTRRDYRPVHHLIWQEAGLTIPPKHILVFRDGNRENITLENLELISMAENAARNSVHRYPAEIKAVIRLQAKVTRKINKFKRASECR